MLAQAHVRARRLENPSERVDRHWFAVGDAVGARHILPRHQHRVSTPIVARLGDDGGVLAVGGE